MIASLDLAKRADIRSGLKQVRWDLVIVDQAHRMSASDSAHKTRRYRIGELLRDSSDHLLLRNVDEGHFRAICENALEGLATKELNLSMLIERPARALILPQPERDAPEVRRLRADFETEAIAMREAIDYEREAGREPMDSSANDLGYDLTSLDHASGERRLIEVKGIGATSGTVLLTPNERRGAEDRRDCYWLYVVTGCHSEPRLQAPKCDPAALPWQEVSKVAHDALTVAAIAGGDR